ncbi:MAG: Trk family potassium uptake protein [Acidobacteria bacterium]|nr:MAG: Trk family potassium uptake protein [Acidobacteriota bacterium]
MAEVRLKPAQMLALSFLFTIGVGTYFLTLPAATADQQGASFLNALFTATSATCVTGLIVVDTSTYWSRFGQTVILILIQIGALGIMTISTSAALLLGRRLGLRERVVLHEIFDEAMAEELIRLIRNIITLTFVIESVGFALLLVEFLGRAPSWTEALYQAVFHSVSAFCNAGFSLASDSLMGFVNDLGVNLIISTLIILGGLGYTVLGGISSLWPVKRRLRLRWRALSLHTKLTLVTSLALISLGTVLFFFFEFDNTLLHLSLKDQIVAAYFQSVTARTAGFNTVDIGQLKPTTLFVLMILMFIGASPGSTGGGIKTTTVAVLILSVRSIIHQREEVEAFGRTISRTMIYKAAAIAVISLGVVLSLLLVLLAVEQGDFLALAFEAVSAFGTVGLSTGITPQLTTWGKLIIIIMMYVGRIGPLTLALAIGEPKRRLPIAYPQGRVWIG